MNYVKSFILIAFFALVGCEREVSITTNDTTGEVTLTMPADGTGAAELIQARGMVDASFTLRAKREEQAFLLKQAEQRAHERMFYAVLVVSGVVTGIVGVFAIGMFIIVKKVGRFV